MLFDTRRNKDYHATRVLRPVLYTKVKWAGIYRLFLCSVLWLFTHLSSRFKLLTPCLVCAPPCWLSAPPRLFAPVPHHLVYLVCVFLCLVASSSLFPPCLKSSSVFHVFQSSSDNDPCLCNRLRVCLLLAGTFASTTFHLDNDPGLCTRLRDCLLLARYLCLFKLLPVWRPWTG